MKVMPSGTWVGQRQLTEIADSQKGPEVNRSAQASQSTAEVAPTQSQCDLNVAVEKMNQVAHIFRRSLQFEVFEPNRIVIRVVDTESGEVIRQVPPQELLDVFSRMRETLGLLLDEKA